MFQDLEEDVEAAFHNIEYGLFLITINQNRFEEKEAVEIGVKSLHVGFCLLRRALWKAANYDANPG